MGYNPWGCKESDMTEYARTHIQLPYPIPYNFKSFEFEVSYGELSNKHVS